MLGAIASCSFQTKDTAGCEGAWRSASVSHALGIILQRAFFVFPKEERVLADFGKKLILGLIAAACVVGAHAAMVSAVVG
jgi:hypothetical protein